MTDWVLKGLSNFWAWRRNPIVWSFKWKLYFHITPFAFHHFTKKIWTFLSNIEFGHFWVWKEDTKTDLTKFWERATPFGVKETIVGSLLFRGVSIDQLLFNLLFNPLSPNSDQHQFSPDNIHMLPRGMVIRVNKMISKEKMLWSAIKLSQLIL